MGFLPVSSGIIPGLVNFLYPAACPACSMPPDSLSHAPFCRKCWQGIRHYDGPSCSICGVPLVSVHADRCRHCLEAPPAFTSAVSFGLYDGVLASAIHHFKFLGIRRLSKPLSALMFFYNTTNAEAIVPVPLSPDGLKNRGFNQALLLAYQLSKRKKVPLLMDVLAKITDTPPQIGLSAKERSANVRKAFTCRKKLPGMSILLIDDVMTTGATVNACSKELLKAGARDVFVLTLSRAGLG